MLGRRAGEQRVEETVQSDKTTKETGGSQQPSKERARGRGQGKHTTSTTPQQSTREGITGGTPRTTALTTGTPHTPHTPTPVPTARGRRAQAARSEGGQPGKGGRLNPGAPHHPRGAQPPKGHASHVASAGPPPPHTRTHSTWVADPDSPPRGRAVGGGGAPELRRPSQRRKASPPGTPFCHPRSAQRRLARAQAVGPCWVLTPRSTAAGTHGSRNPGCRPRGRAAGGGTTPDTRRPSQRWQATPTEDGPPPLPQDAAPTGHASQGDSAGPPQRHTSGHSTWEADPDSPPRGRAAAGGGAPGLGRPSQQRKALPPGTPFRHPHNAQQQLARAHAVEPVSNPQAHTIRTWDTRIAEPRLPAPEDGRPGEGQRLTPDAPDYSGRPSPLGDGPPPPLRQAAPTGHASQGTVLGPDTRSRTHSTWAANPDSPPRGRAAGGGRAPEPRRPSQRRKAPPQGTPFRNPHSAQQRPTLAHAAGPVLGPHAHTNRNRDTRSRNGGCLLPRTGGRGRDSA